MKAEEYINNHRLKSAISINFDEIFFDIAEEGLEMSRNQEREKAMSAFDEVITYALLRRSEGERIRIETMKEQFKELINK